MTIAAMKQALEALEEIKQDTFHPAKVFKHIPTILALRAAISKQEKCEPVATVKIVEHLPDELEMLAVFHPPFAVSDGTKLFTHPAPVPAGLEQECRRPVVKGYCCNRCGSGNP